MLGSRNKWNKSIKKWELQSFPSGPLWICITSRGSGGGRHEGIICQPLPNSLSHSSDKVGPLWNPTRSHLGHRAVFVSWLLLITVVPVAHLLWWSPAGDFFQTPSTECCSRVSQSIGNMITRWFFAHETFDFFPNTLQEQWQTVQNASPEQREGEKLQDAIRWTELLFGVFSCPYVLILENHHGCMCWHFCI